MKQRYISLFLTPKNSMSFAPNPANILALLQDLKEHLEIAFIPFAEPGSTFLNSKREAVIDDVSALARKSTELTTMIDKEDKQSYEPIMLYYYIQGVSRYCYCLTYGLDPKSEKMWAQACDSFRLAGLMAESLKNSHMQASIDSKRANIYPQIASDWSTQNHSLRKVDLAIESLEWLVNYYKGSDPTQAQSFTKSLVLAREWRKKVEAEETGKSELEQPSPSSVMSTNNTELSNQKIWALGIGALGTVLFFGGQWLIGLVCFGVAWFLWQTAY